MYFREDFDDKFYSKNEKKANWHQPGNMPHNERRMPPPPPGNNQYRHDFYPGYDEAELPPPPKGIPSKQASLYAVDPRSIRSCVRNFTYTWLSDGSEFWIYPTYVGRNSISGYRWNNRYGWVYFGVDLDKIESFYCLPY